MHGILDTDLESLDEMPLNSFHRRLAIYSAGGPFLDGYILSIIGVALIQATPQLELDSFWEGMIGASALVGIFLGGFAGGWLADKLGRQTLYTLDLITMILCSVAQYWATSAQMLFICRLLIGAAVGADYPIATALLTEFTPRRYRGPFVGGLMVMWFVGAAVAYGVGELLLQLGPDGWRWMLASAALPALGFVLMRHGTPESPRWLARQGRHAEVPRYCVESMVRLPIRSLLCRKSKPGPLQEFPSANSSAVSMERACCLSRCSGRARSFRYSQSMPSGPRSWS